MGPGRGAAGGEVLALLGLADAEAVARRPSGDGAGRAAELYGGEGREGGLSVEGDVVGVLCGFQEEEGGTSTLTLYRGVLADTNVLGYMRGYGMIIAKA